MSKDGLVDAVQQVLGGSRAEAARAVDSVFDTIVKTLSKGEEVAVTGFGSFRVSPRAARTARNPRTGESISVAATKVPKFRAGKGLKEAVK